MLFWPLYARGKILRWEERSWEEQLEAADVCGASLEEVEVQRVHLDLPLGFDCCSSVEGVKESEKNSKGIVQVSGELSREEVAYGLSDIPSVRHQLWAFLQLSVYIQVKQLVCFAHNKLVTRMNP